MNKLIDKYGPPRLRTTTVYLLALLVFLLVMVIALLIWNASDKSANPEIQKGSWNPENTVYTNEAYGISYTAPSGYYREEADVIQTNLDPVRGIKLDSADASSAADLFSSDEVIVTDGTDGATVLLLKYIDLYRVPYSEYENEYEVAKGLESLCKTAYNLTLRNIGTLELCGVKWTAAYFYSPYTDKRQDNYLLLKDNILIEIIITYTNDSEADAQALLDGLSLI